MSVQRMVDVWQVAGKFGVGQLVRAEQPAQALAPGMVRLRVLAVSLNYRDLLMVRGHYDPRQPLPLVPCSDAVAEVVEVGEGVERVAVGDRVCPLFATRWLSGAPNRNIARSTLGGPLPGTLREEMVLSAEAVVRVPSHLEDAACATLPCAAVTAWRALVTEGGVQPGDTVLTLGTGGVSLFALQIAQMVGARVAVTSSSDAKLARVAAMGAELGVNYVTDARWGKTVAQWAGEGVDHVVELGGGGTLSQSLGAVRFGGTVSLIGVLSGVRADVLLTKILMNHVRVQGILVGSRSDLEGLCRALAARPEVQPVVDRVFPYEEAPEAFAYLASAAHFGKVVVRVAP